MSFVSVVARKNFITIVSDGQATGSNGTVIKDDYQKFIQIGNNAFLAFAGTQQICEMLTRDSKSIFDLYINDFSKLVGFYTTIFNQSGLKELYETRGFKAILAFGGKNNNGEIEFYTVHSKDSVFRNYKPILMSDIKYAFLHSGKSEVNPNDIFTQSLDLSGVNTAEQILTAQKILNYKISLTDSDVNNKTFELVIRS